MKMTDPYKTQKTLVKYCLLPITYCLLSISAIAQIEKQKIAVFTPLYLDSAFDATGKFRFE